MRLTFLPLLLLGLSAPAWAGDVTITILSPEAHGEIRFRLHSDAKGYAKGENPFARMGMSPLNGKVSITLHDVPKGDYAVVAFQDVDGNQQLTRNLLGIPVEPYGFSNDASATLSQPSFAQAAFTVDDQPLALTIHLH